MKAKSGRSYKKIPEGYDIETWDAMTPIERMDALELIDRTHKSIIYTDET